MPTCNFSSWKSTTALIAACRLHVLTTPRLVCSGVCHLQAVYEALGEGFPPLTWLGKSCDVLKISVWLLFSRFGYKNLLVSNCDMYYGLGFTVRIMFRLAVEALSVLAEERHLLHLLEIAFSRSGLYFSSGQPSPSTLTGHCSVSLAWPRFRAVLQAWMTTSDGQKVGDGISSGPPLSAHRGRAVRLFASHRWAIKFLLLTPPAQTHVWVRV